MKKAVVTLFKQVTQGCSKDICMNKYCIKNPFARVSYLPKGDVNTSVLPFATKVVFSNQNIHLDDPNFFCQKSMTFNRNNKSESLISEEISGIF